MRNVHTWPFLLPIISALLVVLATAQGAPQPPDRSPQSVTSGTSIRACPFGNEKSQDVVVGTVRGKDTEIAVETAASESETGKSPGDTDSDEYRADRWQPITMTGSAPIITADTRAQPGDSSDQGADAVAYTRSTAPAGQGAGLKIAPCPEPASDWWWAGAGSDTKHFTNLELINVTDAPAVVDVTLWGRDGPVDAIDNAGIAIKPHDRRVIELSDLAAGEDELAVHTRVRRGSVSAVMHDASSASDSGSEIIPPTSEPHKTVTISGIDRPNAADLLIANPSDHSVRASAKLEYDGGTIVPEGLDQIRVPAGSVKSVPVPESAGDEAASVRIDANHKVFAAARVQPTDTDYSIAVAAEPIVEPAVIPLAIGGRLPDPRLAVSADSDTEVRIETFDTKHRSLGQITRPVDKSTGERIELAAEDELKVKQAAFARVEGKVRGAVVYGDDGKIAQFPLQSAVAQVPIPDLRIGG